MEKMQHETGVGLQKKFVKIFSNVVSMLLQLVIMYGIKKI